VNLAPLAHAPLAVEVHLATVVPAFVIGIWLIFFSRKGAARHRAFGASYLVPLTLVSVAGALWHVRRGNIRGHRNAMIGLCFGGILIAGAFTVLPGRLMHRIFFG
jgi:uncharacterized membrane protein